MSQAKFTVVYGTSGAISVTSTVSSGKPRYNEQMREYEREMDEYKRDSRRLTNVVNGVVGATSLNDSFGGGAGSAPGSSGRGIGLTGPSAAITGAPPSKRKCRWSQHTSDVRRGKIVERCTGTICCGWGFGPSAADSDELWHMVSTAGYGLG